MQSSFYVYTYSCPRTGVVRYVGKGSGKRAYDISPTHHSNYCRNWLKSLKREGLKPIITILISGILEQEAFELERLSIAGYKELFAPLTNLTGGGEGLFNPSAETRQKMSRIHKGKKLSEDHKNIISLTHSGKIKSPEHRNKISMANSGKIRSEETKLKISMSKKGSIPWNKGLKR